ncbi:MAG: PucR family transcriptional regulator [Microbacteriaceae bacterium]
MDTFLDQILQHPSLMPGQPRVVAGENDLHRRVRWVHSSEVLEIAPLLQGGELLLTGGAMLAESSERTRRRYIRDLADRGVTAVAIETGGQLLVMPQDIVDEATQLQFPVIELQQVVPFVQVAEAINSELVDQSIKNLRYATELAHELSEVVADGGGTQDILNRIATLTGAGAVLFDGSGHITGAPDSVTGPARGAPLEPILDGRIPSTGITASIANRGVHTATLWLQATATGDLDQLRLASTTAAQFLSLTLARTRPPSAGDLASSELTRLAAAGQLNSDQMGNLAAMIDFRREDPVVGIAAAGIGAGTGLPQLARILRRYGRTSLDVPSPTDVRALVSVRGREGAASTRVAMLNELRQWALGRQELVIIVGPVVPSLADSSLSLKAALEVAGQGTKHGGPYGVIDAHTHLIDRLAAGEGRRERTRQLVREELAMFSLLPLSSRESLLEGLEAYLDSGCDKSEAARRLRISRQALHGRLTRAFSYLGGDPTGTSLAFGLHFALKARHLR